MRVDHCSLIIFAFILFAIETQTPTNGLFTAGGIAAFIFGSLLLFQTSYLPVSLSLVIAMALAVASFMILALTAIVRTRSRPALTGSTGLVNQIGQARTDLQPNSNGTVLVDGALWRAISSDPISQGQRVRVVAVEGLTIQVVSAEQA